MRRLLMILLVFVTNISFTNTGISQTLPDGYPQSGRTKVSINAGWRFHLGDPDKPYYKVDVDDQAWEEVNVPHTLKLTSINLDGCKDDKTQPTFQRNVGWYRKTIRVHEANNKNVFLVFEGAHQVTDLWVNGKHVGQYAVGGYTPFFFDITNYVQYGKSNQVTLLVDNRRREDVPPDPGPFDYVKFSGLYRDVYLVETDPLRITFNIEGQNTGITITTPSVDPVNMNATIDIKTNVKNGDTKPRTISLVNRVVDDQGEVVLKFSDVATIVAGGTYTFDQIGGIEENMHLWSVERPYLYHVNTMIMEGGKAVDVVDNVLGIRKFEMDNEKGFMLNGKPIELIGFNRHQHFGYIGDAVPDALHEKDMLLFKKMGFNVMRTSHYPQDDAVIKACDRLGILVYEEAPTWINISQNPKWYANVEEAARTMVRNHRNHPSVVIWGAGINHRGYVPQIHYAVKQEDPTRLTASQSSRWTGWQTSGLTDIFGNMNYGPVIWERTEPLLAMEGGYGPEVIAKYKRDPMLTGMISWVAFAYYTFHDIGNLKDRTRLGLWDSFRYMKKNEVMWYPSELVNTPMLYIADPWHADTKHLTVYSNADYIILEANGKAIGKYYPSNDLKYRGLNHPPFEISIKDYQPGRLTARGYIDNKPVVEQSVYTPGKATNIRLTLDTAGREFVANGADILMGYAEIIDDHGMVIRDADATVQFDVKGGARIVGDGQNIGANPIKVRNGYAPVMVRAGNKPGSITVTARAKGLKAGSATTIMMAGQPDMVMANAYSIYDNEKIKVDMGAADQLLQFGWYPWNGVDNEPSDISLPAFGGIKASLHTFSDQGVIRWLGEMNVIGKFGYVYGEGVLAIDPEGLILKLEGLPAGHYKIKTYHHAPASNTDSMDPNREKLKTIKIPSIPHAEALQIAIGDAGAGRVVKNIAVTSGNSLQFAHPATAEIVIESDGQHPVQLQISDMNHKKGVWLNGFELSTYKQLKK